jgi:hypothetical protein
VAVPSQQISTVVDPSRNLADEISGAKFFIGRFRGFGLQVRENRMFPKESRVFLNTVLSAAALARDMHFSRNDCLP